MNQKKIGEFIATCRKEKQLTQAQLAEQLGVTNKTVSRWENGNYMPDLSLLEPLSKVLGVTVTDLLQGKVVVSKECSQVHEENLLSTIQLSKQKVEHTQQLLSLGFILFGLLLMSSAFIIFPKESSWGSIYSILGIFVLVFGVGRELKINKTLCKISAYLGLFLIIFAACLLGDYMSVQRQAPPLYRYATITTSDVIQYKTLFYHVYRIHPNTTEEYYLIDHKKQYTIDTVPISPLNMNKSDIENIMKYQNKYVGNNSNDGALISKLPLSEYGYIFQIDSKNLGLKISYRIMDWYVRESRNDLYLEQSLLYNSATIFLLIENVNYLEFDFSGVIYEVTRSNMEKNFPNYEKLKIGNVIQKQAFRSYVAEAIAEPDFIFENFDLLLKKKNRN